VGLWTTDLLDESGKRHYFHNGALAIGHIVNHTRTSAMDISMDLVLDSNIPDIIIDSFREAVTALVKTNPVLFNQTPSVDITNVDTENNKITLSISCELLVGWYDPRKVAAKQSLIQAILKVLKETNLQYAPPEGASSPAFLKNKQ